jgi:hypothetical protein
MCSNMALVALGWLIKLDQTIANMLLDLLPLMPLVPCDCHCSTVMVPTLYGVRSLKVPQCSMQGDTLVLSGMGVPDPRGFGRGDQYVHLK